MQKIIARPFSPNILHNKPQEHLCWKTICKNAQFVSLATKLIRMCQLIMCNTTNFLFIYSEYFDFKLWRKWIKFVLSCHGNFWVTHERGLISSSNLIKLYWAASSSTTTHNKQSEILWKLFQLLEFNCVT